MEKQANEVIESYKKSLIKCMKKFRYQTKNEGVVVCVIEKDGTCCNYKFDIEPNYTPKVFSMKVFKYIKLPRLTANQQIYIMKRAADANVMLRNISCKSTKNDNLYILKIYVLFQNNNNMIFNALDALKRLLMVTSFINEYLENIKKK